VFGPLVDADAVPGLFALEGRIDVGQPGADGEIEKRMARIDPGLRLQFRSLRGDLFRIKGRLAAGAGEQREDRIQIGLAGELLSHRIFEAFEPCGGIGLFLAVNGGPIEGWHNHQGGGRAEKVTSGRM
jgi:hypothetical protein